MNCLEAVRAKRLFLGFLVFGLICTSACGEEDWYPKDEALAITFQTRDGGTRLQRSFHLSPDDELEADCTIENCSAHTVELCTILFIDYRQVAFEWNGSAAITHLFCLGQDQRETYFMRTPSLKEGYHEFMLVFFSHPFFHSTNPRWRALSGKAMWYWRANLYVGDAVLPSNDFPEYGEYTCPGCPRVPVSVSPSPTTGRTWQWSEQKVEANACIYYFVSVSNDGEEEEVFALIYLLDYRQIPASLDGNELVTLGILPGSRQANITG